ncbi:MAG: hypothetical protein ACJ75B_17835 [Flavisolibacter sp.]
MMIRILILVLLASACSTNKTSNSVRSRNAMIHARLDSLNRDKDHIIIKEDE